jgi:hypothetical protein
MKLSQVKVLLKTVEKLAFKVENGPNVPDHFHITEVGMATKTFIDCGGTIRTEKSVIFQLWSSTDVDHRLHPYKLLNIIAIAEKQLNIEDTDVEVEYQSDTIGKYALAFDGTNFILQSKITACLAEDSCGIPAEKTKVILTELKTAQSACCNPNSGCC